MKETNKPLLFSLWLSFSSLSIIFLSQFFFIIIFVIYSRVHETGPGEHKYYSFGHRFYSKNARKLRFYAFL